MRKLNNLNYMNEHALAKLFWCPGFYEKNAFVCLCNTSNILG